MAKDIYTKIGSWAFLIGVLIAILVGLYTAFTIESEGSVINSFIFTETGGWVIWVLVIIGAIVGILSFIGKGTITSKEGPTFLMAGIALLVMAGTFWGWTDAITGPWIGALFAGISICLAIFVAPIIGLLSIKAIWEMGREV
ncbi:MAG: hypothetical protein AYK22_00310 [Thermoplasmatales archaeon SG8-52-3]|nr:MAG: hypothetical protein AYK22_00310 [Thermoplasmatales archaeon SG8-52-3]